MKKISVKNIKGRKYVYLQYKRNGRVVTKYLGKDGKVGLIRKVCAVMFRR